MSRDKDTEQGGTTIGGFSFGNVGGDAKVIAGEMHANGDILTGDKTTTTTTTTTTITYGFKQEEDKTKFVAQMDELRNMVRNMKTAVEGMDDLNEEQRDELALELTQLAQDLKKVKEEAEKTDVGKEAPKEKAELVGEYLDKTSTIMKKLKKMGEATIAATEKLAPYIAQALPLLASVRHLFGLP